MTYKITSIHKLIDRRIKTILSNDEYIQGRIDTLLEAHIDKRAQQYLDKYFNTGDFISAIVKRLKDKAGITDDYICRITYREIASQVTKLLETNDNDQAIRELFKNEISSEIDNQESEG